MKLEKIDHICIAVRDVKKAEEIYRRTFEIEPIDRYIDENEKINVVRFLIGEVAFEVMEPTDDNSEVAKFLEKRGEGVFLISFKVANVPNSMDELIQKGISLLDTQPRKWRNSNFTFLHPRDYNGVLIELIDEAAGE
jgi:methylmalonyl-CoA/ethylmalonyl-CoA epimerase